MQVKQGMQIRIGTRFHYNYADGNPEWEVVEKVGSDCWQCLIIGDPETTDYANARQPFDREQITNAVRSAESLDDDHRAMDHWYESQAVGSIVHYHNGFGQFVRCEIVDAEGKHQLKPIALVGNWPPHELPHREDDGRIHLPYHAAGVKGDKAWRAHWSNIYESPAWGTTREADPRTMDTINLTVPPMNDTESAMARLHGLCDSLEREAELMRDPEACGSTVDDTIRHVEAMLAMETS